MIAFDHTAVNLEDPRNWRSRPSIHVIMDGHHIQVDAGQEFRIQCIQNKITAIDTFILTHEHADHVLGMEDLRRFCTIMGNVAIPVYSNAKGLQRIREIYPYAIMEKPLHAGYSAFSLHHFNNILHTPGGTIRSIELPHGDTKTLGLIFEEKSSNKRFVYYTDCKEVPAEACSLAKGADVVVLDALYYHPHRSHMSITEAILTAESIGAPMTYFTHFAYPVDHATLESSLPAHIRPAYDGLVVEI